MQRTAKKSWLGAFVEKLLTGIAVVRMRLFRPISQGPIMSKTTSGLILLGGLLLVAIGGVVSATVTSQPSNPAQDWFYDLCNYAGIATILVGLGAFFFGAMRFSRGS